MRGRLTGAVLVGLVLCGCHNDDAGEQANRKACADWDGFVIEVQGHASTWTDSQYAARIQQLWHTDLPHTTGDIRRGLDTSGKAAVLHSDGSFDRHGLE